MRLEACSKKRAESSVEPERMELPEPIPILIDDLGMTETPVKFLNDRTDWALVASPNKPPKTT